MISSCIYFQTVELDGHGRRGPRWAPYSSLAADSRRVCHRRVPQQTSALHNCRLVHAGCNVSKLEMTCIRDLMPASTMLDLPAEFRPMPACQSVVMRQLCYDDPS